jgi:hypothetical protein
MDKHILPVLALDKTITLGGVEPLYSTLFLHAKNILFIVDLAICGYGNGGTGPTIRCKTAGH